MEHLENLVCSAPGRQASQDQGGGKAPHRVTGIYRLALKKAGSFENYRYREDLFPSHRFRMAYDLLRKNAKAYLALLNLLQTQGEAGSMTQ